MKAWQRWGLSAEASERFEEEVRGLQGMSRAWGV